MIGLFILLTSMLLACSEPHEGEKNISSQQTEIDEENGKQNTFIEEDNTFSLTISEQFDGTFLEWEEVANAQSYTVMRREPTSDYELLMEEIPEPSLIDASVDYDQTYYYIVIAKRGAKEIARSNEAGYFFVHADLHEDILSLHWNPVHDATKYIIYRGKTMYDLETGEEIDITLNQYNPIAHITDHEYELQVNRDGNIYKFVVEAILDDYSIVTMPLTLDTNYIGLTDELYTETDENEVNNEDEHEPKSDSHVQVVEFDHYNEITTHIPIEYADPKITTSITVRMDKENLLYPHIRNVEGEDAFLSSRITGYLGAPYEFSVDGLYEEAAITFTYDEEFDNGDEFIPAVFWYNEKDGFLEYVEEQTIDWEEHAVTVQPEQLGTFILLNKVLWDEVWENDSAIIQ